MSAVLVVGSANADLVYRVVNFPKPGETISSLDFKILGGGKGANQAVACARAGASVQFCGCVGQDSFGAFLWDSISNHGVGLDHAQKIDGFTGSAVIFVNSEGENQIVISAGANAEVSPALVERAIESANADFVLVQLEIPDDSVKAVLRSGRRVILNPAPMRNLESYDLSQLYAITPNESECEVLTGIAPVSEDDIRAASRVLLAKGVKNVIITLGRRGCYWTDGTSESFAAAPSVKPVDTTGAGDIFNGILLARLIAGDEFPAAISWATKGASLSTTKLGALESAPTWHGIQAMAT